LLGRSDGGGGGGGGGGVLMMLIFSQEKIINGRRIELANFQCTLASPPAAQSLS